MSAPEEAQPSPQPEAPPPKKKHRSLGVRISQSLSRYVFSSLTQRIVFLNMAALVVLLSGILFLNQFRDSLIEAREESLLTQGEIIAAAIAAQATVQTDSITIDPEKLLELQAGETTFPGTNDVDSLDFPINPEQVAPVLRRLISPTRTRARIYDRDGLIILDSARLYSRGQILRYDLPPITEQPQDWFFDRWWEAAKEWLFWSDLPIYEENVDGNGTAYSEVVTALTGGPGSITRRTAEGDTIVSVAVPVQRFRAVLGVLLLSTEAGDIDTIIRQERLAILRTFAVAAGVAALLSILLASTIAKPLRRLSAAAERVRIGGKSRQEIPDFSGRRDEIGLLSTSLRDMTDALYTRIEAIESFAADVSHELKNPLTSLRSAVETLPLAKNDEQRARLLGIINHDVERLNRLITDISDASRLDAELAREDIEPVDLAELLTSIHSTYASMSSHTVANVPDIVLSIEDVPENTRPRGGPRTDQSLSPWLVWGHYGRLGQVITNLIENARGFVPETGGRIELGLMQRGTIAVITVVANGSGIPSENTERIFDRFYTDRPGVESFGQNSGLGLSISQQIVEAHGGRIVANNVPAEHGSGAVFTVIVPLASAQKPR
ncbi:MAG: stimulus-sensing domain-containing protein [Rhizobiaceae bacterium]